MAGVPGNSRFRSQALPDLLVDRLLFKSNALKYGIAHFISRGIAVGLHRKTVRFEVEVPVVSHPSASGTIV